MSLLRYPDDDEFYEERRRGERRSGKQGVPQPRPFYNGATPGSIRLEWIVAACLAAPVAVSLCVAFAVDVWAECRSHDRSIAYCVRMVIR